MQNKLDQRETQKTELKRVDPPLLSGSNVDLIHDVFYTFSDLLCPDCVLLKLCFHC